MATRHALVAVAALLACAGSSRAQPTPDAPNTEATPQPTPALAGSAPGIDLGDSVEVTLNDGRRIVGELVEDNGARYVIRIGAVPTPFDKGDVRSLRRLPSVEEMYEERRASIADEDVEGRLRLAEWCRAHNRIDLALWETDQALEVEPANPRAKELQNQLIAQAKLNQESGKSPTDQVNANQAQKSRQADAARIAFPLLTPEQINLIRVFEIDLRDPPRMVVPRGTMEAFLDAYKGKVIPGRGIVPVTPEARDMFLHQSAPEALGWFFDARARELYPKVQVLQNPKSFNLFRDSVNRTWLTNACATNRCHGGEEAGRLWLYNLRSSTDAAVYTNFFILDRFRTSTGAKLINYDKPEDSILLQMALPRDQALTPHPEVSGPGKGRWHPVFSNTRDPRYQRVVEWIRSMYPQRPDYPIDYTPPTPRAVDSNGQR
ncbi:MAG: hypothetical protein GC200_07475 [Tepidisphaera sp.]|nr:hypothetical protein [Tepidisphaera sp.]